MADQQLTLDFFGGMLQNVPCPATSGCSSETLRAVLMAIHKIPGEAGGCDGQPCWAGQAAIAARATRWLESQGYGGRSVSERTARRALAVLEDDLQLIISYRSAPPDSRTRKTLDHYVIRWTDVGAACDRTRSVIRPSGTSQTPAIRPGNAEDSAAATEAWPVDRPAWPVDRPAWPVDRPGHNISARAEYGKEPEAISITTTTLFPPSGTDTDGNGRTETDGWAAVVEFLRDCGIGTARKRCDELRKRGLSASESLDELRSLASIAAANNVSAAGLAYRISTGDWPCRVNEDLAAVRSKAAARRREAAAQNWERLLDEAYRDVRSRTPRGATVDDFEVVAAAVLRGVPHGVAVEARGLVTSVVES